MAYITYYRKYRPTTFEEVLSQQHITQTLQNAIRQNRLVHAYLFSGPRGTGKTTVARILAKCLNCKNAPTPTPCNNCIICKRINESFTLDVIEIDGASNRGIEEIRDLREKIKFAPTEGKCKVYIIDEVHMLTIEAFNALLKTLEEPPSHSIFVLATTAPYKLPPTILSRCQRFEFKRINITDIVTRLRYVATQEKLKVDDATLYLIAKQTDGSLRDALSILDQLVAYKGKNITQIDVIELLGMLDNAVLLNFIELIADNNTTKCIELLNNVIDEGKEPPQLIKGLLEYFRDLLLVKAAGEEGAYNLTYLPKEYIKDFVSLADKFTSDRILSIITQLSELENTLRWEANKRLFLEILLIKLTTDTDSPKVVETVVTQEQEQEQREEESKAKKISLTHIKDNWYKVLDKLREVKRPTFTLLTEAKIIDLVDNNLILGFSKEAQFNKEKVENKKNKETIEKIIEEVIGNKINIKCELLKEDPHQQQDDIVEQTLKIFKGKMIE